LEKSATSEDHFNDNNKNINNKKAVTKTKSNQEIRQRDYFCQFQIIRSEEHPALKSSQGKSMAQLWFIYLFHK
jgi:hypothetical protein